jgi:flagellar assembly protein FliH
MSNMSNTRTSAGQQTAYQRWEMSSFGQAEGQPSTFNHTKRKESSASPQMAEILDGIRQEAFTKGVQEGFAVGMAKAKEVAGQQTERFLGLAAAFEEALSTADKRIEEDILDLALDIAKAMLKTKLNVDREAVMPIVRETIHYSPYVQKPARIFVHHEDAKILRTMLSEELSEQVWQIQEDNNIERGGCIVETGTNQIDATNAMRWKRISEALAKNKDWLE